MGQWWQRDPEWKVETVMLFWHSKWSGDQVGRMESSKSFFISILSRAHLVEMKMFHTNLATCDPRGHEPKTGMQLHTLDEANLWRNAEALSIQDFHKNPGGATVKITLPQTNKRRFGPKRSRRINILKHFFGGELLGSVRFREGVYPKLFLLLSASEGVRLSGCGNPLAVENTQPGEHHLPLEVQDCKNNSPLDLLVVHPWWNNGLYGGKAVKTKQTPWN